MVQSNFFLNADTVFDVDFNRMVEDHEAHGALVTLFTHPNSQLYDGGLIIADEESRVQAWLAKEDKILTYYKNRINAGLNVIYPRVFDMTGIDGELGIFE